jgi:uncharacterized protein (TIGR03118 family)
MKIHRTLIGGVAALMLGAASLAYGAERAVIQAAQTDKDNNYRSTILISNEEDEATVNPDPNSKNAWGIAANPDGGPWWVNNNGTNTSTIYDGDGTIHSLVVSVPGAPTGIVFNTSDSFRLAEDTPAAFLFDAEDGSISAWAGGTAATVVHGPEEGSIYKGLAILGDVLYTTDFGHCEVEAYQGDFFNGTFDEIPTGGFEDDSIPAGYCPFGIQAVGDSIFVTFALKEGEDDVAGQGHGFVRQFDSDGNLVAVVGSRGLLNSPWGLAMAPAEGFGKFSGCLLVGNFGDGKINAFCQNNGGQWHHAGKLKEGAHSLSIDGLWGIGFGNDGLAGDSHVLYFAAGPDEEENGYYGTVEFEPK